MIRYAAISKITAAALLAAALGGCAVELPGSASAPKSPAASNAAEPAPQAQAPAPAHKDAGSGSGGAGSAPAAKPAPAAQAPVQEAPPAQPASAAQDAGAAAKPAPTPATAPTPKPAAAAGAAAAQAGTAPAGSQDRKALSWYYMKKGAGKVPDFPKETRSFPADQKAVWVGTGKKVYLTIDNGGEMGDTELLLKSLRDNKVKANFFISGYNIKKYPEYLKKVVADGHLVANHTMTHRDFNKLTDDEVKQEIADFEKLYKDITGKDVVKYFRFPYGAYNRHLLDVVSGLGYTSVFWSTAMRDWEPREHPDDPLNDILGNLHDGNVILMHQGSKENIEGLDAIIKAVKAKGYEFDTVDHLQAPPR
ncbi:polysaccharide deacetylase family protein [Paenibacillus chartarius]|uniref:Polysaccharide deacetylase family protein n=1 Tax=Paenibacillus chartarius TaxID=747481 RepID=A0ABV6DI85_9BACL